MTVEIVDMGGYADRFTNYVMEQLERFDVNLNQSERNWMQERMVEGVNLAREEGGQHWEAAFRGSVDVMMERMFFLANKIDSLSPHPPDSALADEERQMLDQMQQSQQSGYPVSTLSFCPCWPFCR